MSLAITTVPAASLRIESGNSFGMQTTAGTRGKVVVVRSLAASGPGSLAEALAQPFPRLVVFEVGGVIDLDKTTLTVDSPFLTVAGQTAPEPGITVIRGGLAIRSHDVLIQHLRIRPGDAGQVAQSGWEPDAISVTGATAFNVTIDHVSASWAVDENVSASGPRDQGHAATSHDITFSHSIIAEALDYSSHKKGRHSKGALVHDFSQRVAFIGNLFAHNARRNPYFKAHSTGVIINNVIYNADSAAIEAGFIDDEWLHRRDKPEPPTLSVVGNLLYFGRDSFSDLPLLASQAFVYLHDNQVINLRGETMPLTNGKINRLLHAPLWPEGITPLPSEQTTAYVVKNAGARPCVRDAIDQRIITDFLARTGRIIDSQSEVGGYPKSPTSSRALTLPINTDSHSDWLQMFSNAVECPDAN